MGQPPGAVLRFWFGAPGDPGYGRRRKAWFAKDAAFDREIAGLFGGLIEDALAGRLAHWSEQPSHRLARILLLDQFTRNAFRGSARAFAGDPQALADALALVDSGADRSLAPLQRAFTYLPLEHAEDPDCQARSVQLFEALAERHPDLADYADYARRHQAVIERFGRFPHRNAMLGRASSAEERDFLARPDSGF